jgi:uncharacterized protein YndB with AHSA1/START domain
VTASANKTFVPADAPVIEFTRLIDAPRELVWEVWTDPKHIAQWWGPTGFSITHHAMAVKPGGRWDFVMHGPDGKDYDNVIVYHEVVRPERLVYSHGEPGDPDQFHVTVTFVAEGRKTRLVMHSRFPSLAARDHVAREFHAVEGGNQTLDRLEGHLKAQPIVAGTVVSFVRVFEAPRELVFETWVDPKHFQAWWGPAGSNNGEVRLDARPGGEIFVQMRGPGFDHPMGGEYVEIDRPKRLVFLSKAFQGADGDWQFVNHNTVTFEEDGPNRTKLTLVTVVQKASEDIPVPVGGMEAGWSTSLDRLAALLAEL